MPNPSTLIDTPLFIDGDPPNADEVERDRWFRQFTVFLHRVIDDDAGRWAPVPATMMDRLAARLDDWTIEVADRKLADLGEGYSTQIEFMWGASPEWADELEFDWPGWLYVRRDPNDNRWRDRVEPLPVMSSSGFGDITEGQRP